MWPAVGYDQPFHSKMFRKSLDHLFIDNVWSICHSHFEKSNIVTFVNTVFSVLWLSSSTMYMSKDTNHYGTHVMEKNSCKFFDWLKETHLIQFY